MVLAAMHEKEEQEQDVLKYGVYMDVSKNYIGFVLDQEAIRPKVENQMQGSVERYEILTVSNVFTLSAQNLVVNAGRGGLWLCSS